MTGMRKSNNGKLCQGHREMVPTHYYVKEGTRSFY
jgi:hypothetical protein